MKICEPVFDEFDSQLLSVFQYFSKKHKAKSASFGLHIDVTLDLNELINLFQKSKILDEKLLTTEDLL